MKKPLLLFTLIAISLSLFAQKNKKNKKDKPLVTDYVQMGDEPKPDSSTRFTGIIKYRITTDDPAERDSMFIVIGNDQIFISMFFPGNRPDEIIEENGIARFSDSSYLILDTFNKTFKRQHLSAANPGSEFSLMNTRKTAPVMKITCQEFKGELALKDGESFEAACLVSKQHSFLAAPTYNYMNIHPVIMGYRIVLGYRTRSSDNENTYIMAYKIEPGNVEKYFNLAGYKAR